MCSVLSKDMLTQNDAWGLFFSNLGWGFVCRTMLLSSGSGVPVCRSKQNKWGTQCAVCCAVLLCAVLPLKGSMGAVTATLHCCAGGCVAAASGLTGLTGSPDGPWFCSSRPLYSKPCHCLLSGLHLNKQEPRAPSS